MKVTGIILRRNVYWFRRMVGGKRVCVSLQTSDPAEAIKLASDYSRTLNLQSKDSISEICAKCLADRMASGRIRRKTATTSGNAINSLKSFLGDATATHVTPAQATKFYQHLRETMSEAGAQCYIRSLRSIWSWIAEHYHLPVNPFKVKMRKLAKSPRRDFVSRLNRDKLIKNAPNDELRLILLLGFHAGMRKMEIIEARPEWFDLSAGLVHVCQTETFTPKDSDDRTIPMSGVLKDFLKDHPLASPFVIAPKVKHGKSEYRYDFRAPFDAYMKDQKIECTAHTMRRTFASLLVSSGVSIYKVAKWVGDEVATVEKAYAHLIADDRDIDKL